jgi:hypothetical protein
MNFRSFSVRFCLWSAVGLCLIWLVVSRSGAAVQERLLLAPMMNLLEPCIQPPREPVKNAAASIKQWCGADSRSLAPVVETTLSALGSRFPPNPQLELGYTLPIPLLRLLQADGKDWTVDRPALKKFVQTLVEVDRPAIVYLFSTHFGVNAPIEHVLAADPENLLVSQTGALPVDTYLGDEVFPWNFTAVDNGITRRRLQVVDAFLEEVCQLPKQHREKIRGITMLGEVHHMFPKLESGMGFRSPYVITDYSQASKEEFRRFLKLRYRHLRGFNQAVGGDYPSFMAVEPPSKDIRHQSLTRFHEHIDAFAHGSFPVSGWTHVKGSPKSTAAWVRIYRNGQYLGRTAIRGGRQDVAAVHPEFGTADVGWQFDIDFKRFEIGNHRIDVMLETDGEQLIHLGTRVVAVMGRQQQPPQDLPVQALPAHRPADSTVAFSIDAPNNQDVYFYNPLVALWHEFRGEQVMHYLAFFDAHIRRSCLRDTATYTHQILPFINPGWDRHRFAAERSLQPFGQTHNGISLYGDATYGHNFGEWFKTSRLATYGVTEFHPLKPMRPEEVQAMFESHRLRGADFVSFFMEPRGLTDGNGAVQNQFSFDPYIPTHGSDVLFHSTRTVLQNKTMR